MAYIEVDVASPVPIYEQIIDRVRRLVSDGNLAVGALLPSVRQLASDLEINPNTVARAYTLLEREGILETARRRGTQVATAAPKLAKNAMVNRVDETLDRVIRETAHLDLDPDELVRALAKRLKRRAP